MLLCVLIDEETNKDAYGGDDQFYAPAGLREFLDDNTPDEKMPEMGQPQVGKTPVALAPGADASV